MICGYFGLPGAGKSYLLAMDAIKLMNKGYNVYSNFPVLGAYKMSYEQLLEVPRFERPAVLLLDEVQRYANAREWASLPDTLYFVFSQGRKLGLDLFYSAQDSSRVDKTLREVTNYFYDIAAIRFFTRFFYNLHRVSIYSTNANYSLQVKPVSSRFFFMKSSNFSLFDSFYMINKGSFEPVEMSFQEWQRSDFSSVAAVGS